MHIFYDVVFVSFCASKVREIILVVEFTYIWMWHMSGLFSFCSQIWIIIWPLVPSKDQF